MKPLREIAIQVACRGGACCADSDHPGAVVACVALYPSGCDDACAERAKAILAELPAQKSVGMSSWLVEQLAALAPLVCFIGAHPIDNAALTVRISKGATWS